MSDLSAYPEKWQASLSMLAHYPATDLRRQYKRLVIKRCMVDNSLAFLLQYICLMTSTLLSSYSLIWFASGAACAMVFLRHYRVLPGIWLGCFFTYYFAFSQPIFAFTCATVFTVQALLLALITRSYINPSLVFYHAKEFLLFSLCSALITAITSFILTWYCAQTLILGLSWWLANFNGVLIIAIAWITTDTFFTYGGKSFPWHLAWCKTSRRAFAIACLLNMGVYLNLDIFTNLSTILVLQCLLCLATLIGLLLSL